MRILAVGDVHGSNSAKAKLIGYVDEHEPDAVVVCGDITQFGPAKWAAEFLNGIQITTLAVPGNCDPLDVLNKIDESEAINLHGKRHDLGGWSFVGLGGSSLTPFGTPFELSEDEIFRTLKEIMVENAILITHGPPKGHLDSTPSIDGLGSFSIARIVNEYKPKLVISAHIHEARGVERGKITYVNPGPLSKGYAALIELDDDVTVEMLG